MKYTKMSYVMQDGIAYYENFSGFSMTVGTLSTLLCLIVKSKFLLGFLTLKMK